MRKRFRPSTKSVSTATPAPNRALFCAVAAFVLSAFWQPAAAYCPYQCTGIYSNACVAVCGMDRRSPEQVEADAKSEEERQERSRKVLAEFTAKRDKLRTTNPSSPQFKAVFEAYQKARRQRDGDLLGAYVAATSQNMLAVLLTGGTLLQTLDEPYMLPVHSRKAFHEYAGAQMNRVINGASILSIFNEDGSVASNDSGTALSTYGRYVALADKEELDVWKAAHGVTVEEFPPEPVDPAEEARHAKQRAELQEALDRAKAGRPYGQCIVDHFPRGYRPTLQEMHSAQQDCVALKPARR